MEYRYEIDGLRALSVLAVILFHFGLFDITGGYLGVDVFFVISGYLISSILFEEIEKTGTISISNFYLRRTRRILPALLTICICVYLLFSFVFKSPQIPLPNFNESLFATLLSVSNIFFWFHSGYFAPEGWLYPFLHTWSLGIEEQFYILFPLILIGTIRIKGKPSIQYWTIILPIALLSFALCRWGKGFVGADFIFYMLPSRMWELLVGVLVALLLRSHSSFNSKQIRLGNLFSILSVITLAFSFFNYKESSNIAEKSLVASIGAALFIVTANRQTIVGKLFSIPPVRFIGNISYSWYLWHWPMVTLAKLLPMKYGGSTPFWSGLLFFMSFFCAVASWKLIETPFRRMKTWKECVIKLSPAFVIVVAVGGLNGLQNGSDKFSPKISTNAPQTSLPDATIAEGKFGDETQNPSFVLLGDSHANSIYPALKQLAKDHQVAGVFIRNYFSQFINICSESGCNATTADLITFLKENNLNKVFIAVRLDSSCSPPYDSDRTYHGKLLYYQNAGIIFYNELRSFLIKLADSGIEFWIMEQIPLASQDPTIPAKWIDNYSEPLGEEKHNKLLRAAVKAVNSPRIKLISTQNILTSNGQISFIHNDKLLYYDDDHLSIDGALYVAKAIEPFFSIMPQ
ncbi:MAG: hypothetical protein CL942_08200 [Desulfovibrio sp.]|nr:hypothetical protein [Desulfovibrio sp.]|tara:strand:- start:20904 stop:22793 length:1890 start_codon:yes stop_codon:yes gene_type:complete